MTWWIIHVCICSRIPPPSTPSPQFIFQPWSTNNVDTVRGRYVLYPFSTVRAASSSFPSAKLYFDDSWLHVISTLVEADRYIYVYRCLSTGDCTLPSRCKTLFGWLLYTRMRRNEHRISTTYKSPRPVPSSPLLSSILHSSLLLHHFSLDHHSTQKC